MIPGRHSTPVRLRARVPNCATRSFFMGKTGRGSGPDMCGAPPFC